MERPVKESPAKTCYLSELLQAPVLTAEGRRLGRLQDLVVNLELPEPEVTRVVFRKPWSKIRLTIPWEGVGSLYPGPVELRADCTLPQILQTGGTEILLRTFLMDKQIVDINGAKVVRVNDLQFLYAQGKLLLAQVDVGWRGLLRRLGWEKAVMRFSEWFFDYSLKEKFIAWHFVQPLTDPDRLRLQISQSKLSLLHPADLADIIEDLDVHERAAVLESLDSEIIADVMEEVDPKIQVSIMRSLDPDKAADIIEEMSPDEAADLIADLPKDTVDDIFEQMDDDYERTVKGLLLHDEDEAGGLMSTRLVSLGANRTILDALAYIKDRAGDIDVIYYIYIVDRDSRLLGVTNLRELLSNEIFTPLDRVMSTRLITARVDASAKDLVHLFGKYGFRAIPVVDEEGRLQGVVKFKALLDLLAPYIGR
jgi:magnesium transporter